MVAPDVNLLDPGLDPVRVKTIETSGNLFSVLGVGTQAGPGFPADGPFFSNDLIAVISDRLWRTRYNADPAVVGKSLNLNGTPYLVVGVMPQRFRFPDDIDVWQRLRWDLSQHSRRGMPNLTPQISYFPALTLRFSAAWGVPRSWAKRRGWTFCSAIPGRFRRSASCTVCAETASVQSHSSIGPLPWSCVVLAEVGAQWFAAGTIQ